MAYDNKRLKTLKWLQDIASKKRKYQSGYRYETMKDNIFIRFGRFYATDSYILARVDYPENEHDGDECWQTVKHFTTADGKLMETFEFENVDRHMQNDFFERVVPYPKDYANWQDAPAFDASLFEIAIKGFKINDIPMSFAFTPEKCVISGHNKDVSILVVIMGTKRR